MRAVFFEEHGGTEVLRVGAWPRPRAGAGEVLVAVHAASVNPRDWLIREGRYFAKPLLPKRPFVLGSDVAGVVAEVGRGVEGFAPGDEVFAMRPTRDGFGAYAEYVAVRASAVARKPENLSFAEAAAMPLAALTALQALRDDARLEPGRAVVVVGASGGVGSYAVQIARNLGAEVVGVCSERNAELVRDLGASRVIDYRRERFQDVLTGKDRVDVVFDTIGKESLASCARVLRPGGVYVTTVPTPGNALASLRTRLLAPFGARRSRMVLVRARGEDLDVLRRWAEAGELRSVIDLVVPLENVVRAHEHSRSFRTRGKNVLIVRPGS